MIVLVCGGRDYDDKETLGLYLDFINKTHGEITKIIHGNANGADSLSQDWAMRHGIEFVKFLADWKTHGKSAGHIRNKQMLYEGKPDLVVAFPGGVGTDSMVRYTIASGTPILIVPKLD